MHWLWTQFTELPWWGMTLWGLYTIYFILRAWYVWSETSENGLLKGYKIVFIGEYEKTLRLYHLLRMIFDIPPAILGLVFPICRTIFTLKIYEFNKEGESKDGKKRNER
ncbi:hypothetical protein M2277_004970 [Paenibacillus sp. LBL]|uniref:hypothetical protein n=1 Tax=Paenibacillus sp. LBL TaxID=2940563 RepID=UPI002474ACAD|nr:hypothetical protein [Paenibacillus sp. LBL]MDH6674278.1 hypothetical protein [Paenibacillus sp. LBL]